MKKRFVILFWVIALFFQNFSFAQQLVSNTTTTRQIQLDPKECIRSFVIEGINGKNVQPIKISSDEAEQYLAGASQLQGQCTLSLVKSDTPATQIEEILDYKIPFLFYSKVASSCISVLVSIRHNNDVTAGIYIMNLNLPKDWKRGLENIIADSINKYPLVTVKLKTELPQ